MLKTKSTEKNADTSLLSKSLIPIIDLAHCGTEECPVKSVVTRVAHQLHKALSEKGMAFLVNHGISDEKLKTAWDHLDDFCDLPVDVKSKYFRLENDNHGYDPVEPGGKNGLRHAYNVSSLNEENFPEEELPGFSEHISTLARDFKTLANFVLQAMAISLDFPQMFFSENHMHMLSGDSDNKSYLKILYYPPIIEDDSEKREFVKGQCKYSYQRCLIDQPDFRPETSFSDENNDSTDGPNANSNDCQCLPNGTVIRCGENTDYGTFTLLAQDSEGGLEVKMPGSEKWHRLGHLPGAILIKCGAILSAWTQGRYPALQHRVTVPMQEHIRLRGRHSIAFYCHPDNNSVISDFDEPHQIAEETSAKKKTRKKSFKAAKEKVINAYQSIQRRFRDTNNTQ